MAGSTKFIYPSSMVMVSFLAIDSTKLGTSTLYTADTFSNSASASALFFPINLIITCTATAATASTVSCSLGTNASSYNNLVPTTALTGVSAAGKYLNIPITSVATSVSATTPIILNITTAFTGATQSLSAILLGVYL